MSVAILTIVAFLLYRYIVQRCRELRRFEERGIAEPMPPARATASRTRRTPDTYAKVRP